jgi:hypothetical protein
LTDFLALYRGRTIADAELVAVSAERRLVERFFADLLSESTEDRQSDRVESNRTPTLAALRDEE